MHDDARVTTRGARWRLGAFWFFLTVTATGFALLGAGLLREVARDLYWGATLVGFGVLLFVFTQFSMVAPGLVAAGGRPIARAAPARELDFVYEAPSAAPKPPRAVPTAATTAPERVDGEGLVEFQLVEEMTAPTRLEIPEAFQVEQTVQATPSDVLPWRRAGAERGVVPAIERRSQMVSGLPLLSSILADDPPRRATIPAERNGKVRGQCGNCQTMLWAPKERPIRLRCPKCGHVRTLTS